MMFGAGAPVMMEVHPAGSAALFRCRRPGYILVEIAFIQRFAFSRASDLRADGSHFSALAVERSG